VGPPHEASRVLRVLIVEDHPVVAEGLASLLEDYPDLTVVGRAESVAEAASLGETARADVAIVDFHLPDGTGAEAAERIRARSPSTAFVFLSADDSDELLLAAIEAGASSYLLKTASGAEIVKSIRSAAAGETLIPASAMARVLAGRRDSARQAQLLDTLTPRERQVLALMSRGADNRTIARELYISYATVRTHVRSILVKLGARSQLDAVAKAARSGFRPDEPA
jgi:DNA-binding NarL/FixJ family response regulator